MITVLLLTSQIILPVTPVFLYAASTTANQVGSSGSLDPVGNKATRLQTQGSSGVDQSSGALTYSYPLSLPQGRNGMAPTLTLSYNSQNNDSGWFGYNWLLSIPYIDRTVKTGSDKLYTNPAFVSSLHGELISGNGVKYEQKVDDGSYAQYSYSGNTWQMVDRDGTTYYFGTSHESRVQDDAGTKIGRWYLTEVRDKFGNGIVYSYTKNEGAVYPATISYTEHAMAHPLNLVTFSTENRSDKFTSYRYGFKVVDSKRISAIKVTASGKDAAYFVFTYTTGSNGVRSLLQSVEEKHLSTNGDWTTLPKTSFEYEKSAINLSGSISLSASPYGTNTVIDTNNDGLLDLYNAGDGYYAVDINGDYKKDLMQSDVGYGAYSNSLNINFKYNQGGTFFLRSLTKASAPAYLRSFPTGNPAPPLRYWGEGAPNWAPESVVTDVNGDGFDDIVYNDIYGSSGAAINTTNNTFDYSISTGLGFNINNDSLADVNGDGLQDKISKSSSATSTLYNVYLNTGSGYASTSYALYDAKIAPTNFDTGVDFVDVNNDGLLDILRSYTSNWHATSNPTCTEAHSNTPSPGPISQSINDLYINTGSAFVAASSSLSGYLVDYESCDYYPYSGLLISKTAKKYDVNGDLTTDYDGVTNLTKKQDVLKKVTSSLGSTLDISYVWSTASSTANPVLPVPMYIVGTTTEMLSPSDPSPHIASYTFMGGQMYFDEAHPRDHKFAGFGKVETVTDGKSKTVTYLHQGNGDDYTTGEKGDSYYAIGRSYRTDTYDLSTGSSTLVGKNLALYTTYSSASSTFTYVDSQVSNTYNVDGTFESVGSKNIYDQTKRLVKTAYNYGDIEPFISFASSTLADKGTDLTTTEYEYSNTRPQRLIKQLTKDYSGQTIANTTYVYDGLPYGLVDKGAVTSTVNIIYNADGSVNATSTTQTSYDVTGNSIQATDSLGHTTKVVYDSTYFFPLQKIDANNATTTYTYDPYTLNLVSTKGPDGITYVQETDGLGKTTHSYSLDVNGGMYDEIKTSYVYGGGIAIYTRKLGASGQAARTAEIYDSYGRLIQSKKETTEDVFSTQDTTYDASSNISTVSLPYTTRGYGYTIDTPTNGQIVYTYDGVGRVKTKTSFGSVVTYQYGARSLTVQDNASTQHKKTYLYNAAGNLSQVKEYNNGTAYTTVYTYTPNNKLSSISDADGNIRAFSYLSNGSLAYQEDPHPATDTTFTTYSYSYDTAGNLLSKTGPLGVLTYTYDAINRPLTRTLADSQYGTSTVAISYTGCSYNYLSPCTIDRSTSSTTLSYTPSGKLSSENLSVDGSVFSRSYTYDTFGNPTRVTYPDNGQAVYTYTLDGKQTSLAYITPQGATKNIINNATFTSLGALSSLSFGNGIQQCNSFTTSSTDGVISPRLAKSSYVLNALGCASGDNQIELYKDEFTYNDAITPNTVLSTYKDIAGITHTKNDTFTYDNLARLTHVSTSYDGGSAVEDTLVYDPVGNLLKENDVLYAYSQEGPQNAHAVTSIGGTHISYDAQGNRIQVGDSSYTWNALNQLVTATSTNGTESYVYDENGERIKKTITATQLINQKVTPTASVVGLSGYLSNNEFASLVTVDAPDRPVITGCYDLNTQAISGSSPSVQYDANGYPYQVEPCSGRVADYYGNNQTFSPKRYVWLLGEKNDADGHIWSRIHQGNNPSGQYFSQRVTNTPPALTYTFSVDGHTIRATRADLQSIAECASCTSQYTNYAAYMGSDASGGRMYGIVTTDNGSLTINSQSVMYAALDAQYTDSTNVYSTSTTYVATSTQATLSSLQLNSAVDVYRLVTPYYSSPFIGKYCSSATSTAARQVCSSSTLDQLVASALSSRSTSTVITTGLVTDTVKIAKGIYLLPSSYTGIATSSIATTATSTFTIDTPTISAYTLYTATGIVTPLVTYGNLPYVSTSTYNALLTVGLQDTSKVRMLLSFAGCDSTTSACVNAKKVVFEKFYKENGYLLSDKALQEMWYVYAGKARLPGNAGELTSTSTYLGSISVPSVSSLTTSVATSTYYANHFFTTEYSAQNLAEPRLQYFNAVPYFITQAAFSELDTAGVTQTTLENYSSLISDVLGIKTASSTEYIFALKSFVQHDKNVTLSSTTLKELYLTALGAAVIPNNIQEYTQSAVIDLAPYLSVQTVYGTYSNTLSNTTTGCNGGAFQMSGTSYFGRCKIRVSPFSLPVATTSTVTYLLSVTAPNPTDFILNAGESANPTYAVDNYNYATQVPVIYTSRYAPATPAGSSLDYVSGTISSNGWTQTIDVTPTIVKEKASSTESAVILLMNRSGWTNGQSFEYQSLSTVLKAYVDTPRLTLASTTLVSGVTSATSTAFTSGIQNSLDVFFGENHDSSTDISMGTSSPLIFISPESAAEFASTTLKDAYGLSRVFMATSTSQCASSASTTECDKQIRKTAFREIVGNLSGFTPSQAATEEFWMVHKGMLSLPNTVYASTTASTTIAGHYVSSPDIGVYIYELAPGYYSTEYTATTTASTTVTILNTQAGGTTFTPGTNSQYVLAFCGSYCDTPVFNGVSMTNLLTQASPNTNSNIRVFGIATTTAGSVSVTSNCGGYCGNAVDHYRWVSLKGLNTSSYYYDIQGAAGNSASSLSATENIQDKNNLVLVSSNISTSGTSGGTGSSPLVATTTSRLWYHYATTTGNISYTVTGLGGTDAEVESIQMNHDPNDTVIPGFYTTYYHATTTAYYMATSTGLAQLVAASSTVAGYPVFSRSNLPSSLSTTTSYLTSTTTVPGYWATQVVSLSAPTGGTITTVGTSTIHTFTSSGTFVAPSSFTAKVLVVGGGGNGGYGGGGGGAGQYQYNSAFSVTPQSYSVVVGAAAATSSFGGIVSIPGGQGGSGGAGFSGASGGGAGEAYGSPAGGVGTAGYNGATGDAGVTGGGGGSSAVGSGRTGGAGTVNSITGTSTVYAVGGGGGASQCGPAGGPNGGSCGNTGGVGATPGSGGGGGAQNNSGGSGASGIVVISYPTALFQGTTTSQVYIATTTLYSPITHLNLVPQGLLSDVQFKATYATSSFALATTTRTVSNETYNELLNTPLRLDSDINTLFDYALPFATSTCPGEAATSSCVISAQKSKVKDTVGVMSGFILSDAALAELYKVNNNELNIVPIDLTNVARNEITQSISLPLDLAQSFITFATTTSGTSTTNFTQTAGVCSFGTQTSTSTRCFISLPHIYSPITNLMMRYDFATSSVATSTVISSLVTGAAAQATSTITGQKSGATFTFDITSPYQLFAATTSASLLFIPQDVASSTVTTIANPVLTITRKVSVPYVVYDTLLANLAISRSEVGAYATTTATSSISLASTTPVLPFSMSFVSPLGAIQPQGATTTTTYTSSVATTSILAYYTFDTNSNDSIAANNNTDTAITYSSGNGKIASGAGLNATSSVIKNTTLALPTTEGTVSGWIKTTDTTTGHEFFLFGADGITGSGNTARAIQFRLEIPSGGTRKVGFITFIGGSPTGVYSSSGNVADGNWHFLVGTWKSGEQKLYVDGTNVATGNATGNLTARTGFAIGDISENAGTHFYGALSTDEVSVWSRALTGSEVTTLYNSGTGRQYPFLTATTTPLATTTAPLAYSAAPVGKILIPLSYDTLPSQSTSSALSAVAYPYATSTATSSLYTLSTATTTSYTVYTPFSGYSDDVTRGVVTTYLTLNGQLVGTYSYDKSNPSGGKVTYLLTNYLGTPVIQTDAQGDIVEMDITDVFGNYVQRDQRNDNALHTKSYTGHEYDDVTGNIYAHARYIDPKAHTFLSVDPMLYKLPQAYLVDPQQMNSYAYARNNPITYTDPTGGYIESALDVGFIAYDLNSLKNNLGQGNYYDAAIDGLALVGDGIGLAVPGGTGFGMGIRFIGHGGDANKAFSGAKQMVSGVLSQNNVVNGVQTTKQAAEWLNKGNQQTDVYLGIKNGQDVYVGISKNVEQRAKQHGQKFDTVIKQTELPTRNQARAVEQTVINTKGKAGANTYQNAINSISPNRSIYNDVLQWAQDYLKKVNSKLGK